MNPKEIQERLTDVQEATLNLEERITELERREPIAAGRVDLEPILHELHFLREMLNCQREEYQSYFKQKPSISKSFRFLLFPEKNPKLYYMIVFGRLLPWGTLLLALTVAAIIGGKGLAVYDHKLQVDDDLHYKKAWQVLQQQVSPKTGKAMEDAFDKTK